MNGLTPFVLLVGTAMILAALLTSWEDGLAFGPAAILVGYALSLTPGNASLDGGATFVAVGLLATVELGTWSLELRDGPEERAIKHVARFLGLLFAAFATSLVILAVGGAQPKAGIALFVIGAVAALGLFLLLAHSTRPTGVQTEPNKPLAMQGRRSP